MRRGGVEGRGDGSRGACWERGEPWAEPAGGGARAGSCPEAGSSREAGVALASGHLGTLARGELVCLCPRKSSRPVLKGGLGCRLEDAA